MPRTKRKRIFQWGFMARALARSHANGIRPRTEFDKQVIDLAHKCFTNRLIAKLCKRVYAISTDTSIQLAYVHSHSVGGKSVPSTFSTFAYAVPAARGGTQYSVIASAAGVPIAKHTLFSRADSRVAKNRTGFLFFYGYGEAWREGTCDAYWEVGPKAGTPGLSDALDCIAESSGSDEWKRKATRFFRSLHRESRRFQDLIVRYRIYDGDSTFSLPGRESVTIMGAPVRMIVHAPTTNGTRSPTQVVLSAGDGVGDLDWHPRCLYAFNSCNAQQNIPDVRSYATLRPSKLLAVLREFGAASVQAPC